LLLLPVGLAYFAIYYGTFRWAIVKFDLKTPGREPEEAEEEGAAPLPAERGLAFVEALGGAGNLASIDACTTRLRLVVNDQAKVSEARLKKLGARGFIRPSAQGLQVVLGPIADSVAMEMRAAAGPLSAAVAVAESRPTVTAADPAPWLAAEISSSTGPMIANSTAAVPASPNHRRFFGATQCAGGWSARHPFPNRSTNATANPPTVQR